MQFHSPDEVAAYVAEQCRFALPEQSHTDARGPSNLRWRISCGSPSSDCVYIIEFTTDLKKIIIYYGNTDAGPLSIDHLLLNALVFHCEFLERCPLLGIVEYVGKNCAPNRWDLT